MQLRKHKTAIAANNDTSSPILGNTISNDVSSAGEGFPSVVPSPAPAPEMLFLKQRLEESERAVQLANNRVAEMQAAQRQQQQEMSPQKERFLNNHPEARQQMHRLGQLHRAALVAGLPDDSNEYFNYLERALAEPEIKVEAPPIEPEPEPVPEPPPPPPEPPRSYAVSAPVHREAVSLDSGRPQGYSSKIQLSPEQREHCKLSGVDEVTYARGVLRLEREKRAGTRQA